MFRQNHLTFIAIVNNKKDKFQRKEILREEEKRGVFFFENETQVFTDPQSEEEFIVSFGIKEPISNKGR